MAKSKKKKKKDLTWLWIILGAIFMILFYKIASFGNMNNVPSENIIISGLNTQKTLNYPNQEITLMISGNNNIVQVTKDTTISKITISGITNTINLCYTHSPKIMDSGINNIINYVDC
jgi:hypothetical protein